MGRVRRIWTPEEDALLRSVVNNALAHSRPLLWRELAKSVPGRSNKDCRRRWWNSLADGTAKGSWSEEEDERLIEAVRKHGTNWSQVAKTVVSRNPDQCSSHWSQVLDPDINYCDWTTEEDEHLLHAVLTHGTNWTSIAASHAPKRTTLALKNRYSTLRLRHENGNKSKEITAGKVLRASPSSFKGAIPTSKRRMRTDHKYLSKRANEGDEDVEEDDDEEEDDEDEDGEEEDGDGDEDDGGVPHVQLLTNFKKANTGKVGSHAKDSNIATSDTWAGLAERSGHFIPSSFHHGTSPLSTENWTDDTADHAPYESPFFLNHPSIYAEPGEDIFGAFQGPGGMSTSAPDTIYGGNAMDIFPSPSPSYPTPIKPAPASSASGNLVRTGSSPSQASRDVSTSPTAQGHHSTTYQISIDMVCTGAQLEAVMVRLAGAGTCLNMKIDPKS